MVEDYGNFGDAPNEKWGKFFMQFPEVETLEVAKWKPIHLLSYFCKKFYQAFNTAYQFKYNSPSPAKSFEVFQIKRLALLLSADPCILRDYINWAFREKVGKGKSRVRSISFLTNEEMVNNYKFNVLLENKPIHIDRSTPLPNEYKERFSLIGPINTYGDLSFFYQTFEAGLMDTINSAVFDRVLKELTLLGFDIDILKRIT